MSKFEFEFVEECEVWCSQFNRSYVLYKLSGPVLRSGNGTVINATVGSDVTLICETDVMTYGVVWYFNNEPVTRGDVVVRAQQGTLTISSLKLTDSGWYTCAADDQFGRDEMDFLLLVGGEVHLYISFYSCHMMYNALSSINANLVVRSMSPSQTS